MKKEKVNYEFKIEMGEELRGAIERVNAEENLSALDELLEDIEYNMNQDDIWHEGKLDEDDIRVFNKAYKYISMLMIMLFQINPMSIKSAEVIFKTKWFMQDHEPENTAEGMFYVEILRLMHHYIKSHISRRLNNGIRPKTSI